MQQFDLDARIAEAITLPKSSLQHPGAHSTYVYSPDVAMAVKELLRDALQAVKLEPAYRSGDYFLGYNAACKDFETNITSLLGDK